MIKKIDPAVEETVFGTQLDRFFTESENKLKQTQEEMEKAEKRHQWICDYFMFDKKDEVRVKSEKFFKFFTEYFDNV